MIKKRAEEALINNVDDLLSLHSDEEINKFLEKHVLGDD